MKIIIQTFFLISVLLFPAVTFAWDAVAHQVIFAIAYQQLTPTVKQKVTELIHAYPDEQTANGNYLASATWADRIKHDHVTTFNHWHYIDQPWGDLQITFPKVRGSNILTALASSERMIQSKQNSQLERALYLRFLIHLEGDLHQPLHVSTHMNAAYPKGDHGGLLYKIHYHNAANLHELWDSGFHFCTPTSRTHYTAETIMQCATRATKIYPSTAFSPAMLNASHETIAQDGLTLTQQEVYRLPENHYVTDAYAQRNRGIAERQIALAGYRLGTRLNALFGRP
jgi:hypothetical protein